MTNRQARRAVKLPELPRIPNISGTPESCKNCVASRDKEWRAILHLMRQPPPAEDELVCLYEPGGGRAMKTYGWCSKWANK